MRSLSLLLMVLSISSCIDEQMRNKAQSLLGDGAVCSPQRDGYIRCSRKGQAFTCVANYDTKKVDCFAGPAPSAEVPR